MTLYKVSSINFASEIMGTRRQWEERFKVLKESLSAKNPNETTNETTFQNFGEIKTFSGK